MSLLQVTGVRAAALAQGMVRRLQFSELLPFRWWISFPQSPHYRISSNYDGEHLVAHFELQ
jgi:hypothetical protein